MLMFAATRQLLQGHPHLHPLCVFFGSRTQTKIRDSILVPPFFTVATCPLRFLLCTHAAHPYIASLYRILTMLIV